MPTQGITDSVLPVQFGLTVHTERIGDVIFDVGFGLRTIKNVIGRIMHEQRPHLARIPRQLGNGIDVDTVRQRLIALGLIDSGVGRRIDDDFGFVLLQHGLHLRGLGQIALTAIQCGEQAQRR